MSTSFRKSHHRATERTEKFSSFPLRVFVSPWLSRVSVAVLILAILISPIATAHAQSGSSVTASGVIAPAHVAHLGFLNTAIVRDMPVKEGDTVAAGQTLATLDTPELGFAITSAEASLRAAQTFAELQRYGGNRTLRQGRTVHYAPAAELVQKADLRVTLAQAQLDEAKANLAQSTLAAPFDGTVTDIAIFPGQPAQLGQTVITIATLGQLQIETTDLAERDIAKIKVGQKATIFVDALQADFPATVTAIAPRAEKVGGDVVFKVTLTFDDPPAGLLWGMTADVTITTN